MAGGKTAESTIDKKADTNLSVVTAPDLKGMYLLQAMSYLKKLGLKIGKITYQDKNYPQFTVIDQNIKPGTDCNQGDCLNLVLSGINPVRYLPSIFQSNQTLSNFLWIFQHVLNSLNYKLDNIHRYFNPLDAPDDFYKWLGTWFSIDVNYSIDDQKMRHLIKNAVNLHQWRGTVAGLTKYLAIVTDVTPQIIEGHIPYKEYVIKKDKVIENFILAQKTSKYYFTVHFPVSADHFDIQTLKKIYQIIAAEKPAHTDFSITFIPKTKEKIKTSLIIGTDMIQ